MPRTLHRCLLAPILCGEVFKTTTHTCYTSQSSCFYTTGFLFQAMILTTIKRDKTHFHSEGKHAAKFVQPYSNVQCRRRKTFYFKRKPVLIIEPSPHMPLNAYIQADCSAHRHKLYAPSGGARISCNDKGRQDSFYQAFIKTCFFLRQETVCLFDLIMVKKI